MPHPTSCWHSSIAPGCLPRKPTDDPGRRLRIDGFSPEAARELVGLCKPELEAKILATIRGTLANFIAWLRADDVDEPRALALVFDAVTREHAEHVDALLMLAEHRLAVVEPGAVAGFLERGVAGQGVGRRLEMRAIDLLRRLPPSPRVDGLRRYRLLGRLAAVRTREDLERCLDDCRRGPDHAGHSAAVLCEAFQIPSPPASSSDGEPPELTAMRDAAQRWHAIADDRERARWLASMLAERPLDVPLLETMPTPTKPRFSPSSAADLQALLATLQGPDEQERSRAAARLLDWPDTQTAWPAVLEAFLRGRATVVSAEHKARLAPILLHWPSERLAQPLALMLWPACTQSQQRAFVRQWIAGWQDGSSAMLDRLRGAPEELLLPFAWDAAERGDFRLLHVLRPSDSPAMRALVAWVQPRAPMDVEHLLIREDDETPDEAGHADDAEDPDDPIAGREPDELVALIDRKDVAKGLAVRAVHALVAHGEPAIAPLMRLVTDKRPPVRSAALRALRQVASREQSLAATADALAMETRRDVISSLMRSLGHGRYEPTLPALLERLDHGDLRTRQGAHEAIRAWGREVVPALRRMASRARPDRRPTYAALIAELEPPDD